MDIAMTHNKGTFQALCSNDFILRSAPKPLQATVLSIILINNYIY